MDKRSRLRSASLYLVCDGRRDNLEQFLEEVLSAGVDIVQLREKTMEATEQIAIAKTFRAACDRHGALFIMNDRVDLALACDADGVHLGQDDIPLDLARSMMGPDAIIGRSTHSISDVHRAMEEDADYIACGPVYQTPTKPGRPATGLLLIEEAKVASHKPWFAIGGIDANTIEPVVRAGASRIAMVRAIGSSANPAAATRSLKHALPSRP
ncbi:MAG: thiamine phosphate synthase [Actinomycetota bacterium]